MNKLIILVLLFVTLFLFSCGKAEKLYDESNYESLTNETGKVEVFSGGKIIRTYENAKILYSSSDTQAMWIDVSGKEIYLQGDCIITLN